MPRRTSSTKGGKGLLSGLARSRGNQDNTAPNFLEKGSGTCFGNLRRSVGESSGYSSHNSLVDQERLGVLFSQNLLKRPARGAID